MAAFFRAEAARAAVNAVPRLSRRSRRDGADLACHLDQSIDGGPMNFTSYTLAPPTRTSELERSDTLHRWLVVFRSRSRLFACVVVVIIASSALVTPQVTPRHIATARMTIHPHRRQVSSILDVLGNDSDAVGAASRSLESRVLAGRTAAPQKLDQGSEFARPGATRTARDGLIGKPVISVEFADLQRQASAIRSLYDGLLSRVQRTRIAGRA
ncbi:MAG: hypothetical protein P4M09_21910 [Devosia sp.]|nr:hypothetical protein [Devosia sp.]